MPEEMPPQTPTSEDPPIETTPQMPTQETPQYASPEPEQATPWTPEAAGTEDSGAVPEAASSEMPASEDPNKIIISEGDLNSSEPTEADAEKKIDLMDSFGAPASEASSEEPAAPQAGSGERIDLTDALGAPSESIVAPETPTSTQEGSGAESAESETSSELVENEELAQAITQETAFLQEMKQRVQNNPNMSQEDKNLQVELLEEEIKSIEQIVRDEQSRIQEEALKFAENYKEFMKNIMPSLLTELRDISGSEKDKNPSEKDFLTLYVNSLGGFGVHARNTAPSDLDQENSIKVVQNLMVLLGCDSSEETLATTENLVWEGDDMKKDHPITIAGKPARLVENLERTTSNGVRVYRLKIVHEPAA